MSVFIKQYGKVLAAAAAAVLVFGIAFRIRIDGKTGFIQAAYGTAMADMDVADVRTFSDAAAVKAVAARDKPQITFQCAKILPQVPADIGSMLTAKDADGRQIACEMTEMTDASGTSILDLVGTDLSGLLFPSAGIYVMTVKAVDLEQKTASVQFRVPVTGN